MQKYILLICLVIASAVLMNSAHAKDVLYALPFMSGSTTKNQSGDKTAEVKINVDLHNHVDKAGKIFSGDNPQSDSRSLRLLRERRPARHSVLDELFGAWRERLSLYLG